MASTRETAFREMPGAAPDVMRDYDLATLGYEETEFCFEGTAALVRVAGRAGAADGRWDVGARRRGSVPDPHCGAEALEPVALQRHGRSSSGTTSRPASTPRPTGGSSIAR